MASEADYEDAVLEATGPIYQLGDGSIMYRRENTRPDIKPLEILKRNPYPPDTTKVVHLNVNGVHYKVTFDHFPCIDSHMKVSDKKQFHVQVLSCTEAEELDMVLQHREYDRLQKAENNRVLFSSLQGQTLTANQTNLIDQKSRVVVKSWPNQNKMTISRGMPKFQVKEGGRDYIPARMSRGFQPDRMNSFQCLNISAAKTNTRNPPLIDLTGRYSEDRRFSSLSQSRLIQIPNAFAASAGINRSMSKKMLCDAFRNGYVAPDNKALLKNVTNTTFNNIYKRSPASNLLIDAPRYLHNKCHITSTANKEMQVQDCIVGASTSSSNEYNEASTNKQNMHFGVQSGTISVPDSYDKCPTEVIIPPVISSSTSHEQPFTYHMPQYITSSTSEVNNHQNTEIFSPNEIYYDTLQANEISNNVELGGGEYAEQMFADEVMDCTNDALQTEQYCDVDACSRNADSLNFISNDSLALLPMNPPLTVTKSKENCTFDNLSVVATDSLETPQHCSEYYEGPDKSMYTSLDFLKYVNMQ